MQPTVLTRHRTFPQPRKLPPRFLQVSLPRLSPATVGICHERWPSPPPECHINGSIQYPGFLSLSLFFEIRPWPCMIQYFVPFCSLCHYPDLFIHLPLIDNLGRFQFGAIMSKAVMNILVPGFCGLMFSFLLDKYLRMELLGHRVALSLTLFSPFFQNCQMAKQICVHQFYPRILNGVNIGIYPTENGAYSSKI